MILLIAVLTGLLSSAILISDGRQAASVVTQVGRNTYGKGSATKSFRVLLEGEEEEERIEIEIGERQYTAEEMEKIFARTVRETEEIMLGKNKSLDQVKSDLNLVTEIPGKPVEIVWETDRYDLLNLFGERNEEKLTEFPDGVLVGLKACFIYTENPQIRIVREMTARLYPSGNEESNEIENLKLAVEQEEEKTKTEESVSLPSEINGRKVEFRNEKSIRGWSVLLMGGAVCVLLAARQYEYERKQKEKRDRQMMLDYPEILNKLALLLGAGMSGKKAWQKIADDYEMQKPYQGERFAYEELVAAGNEMNQGITETESYKNFGYRCGLPAYRKLAALLTQNIQKGTQGLADLLNAEAESAFEERKATAKKRGEEAGTKLLAPMFLMLAMVLVLVIVPAFLSIQL